MIVINSTQNRNSWEKDINPTELSTDIYSEAIIQDSILNGIERNLFRLKDQKEFELIADGDELEVDSNLGEVKRLYGFRNTTYYSKKTQRWIGHITKVEESKFFSRLDDLSNPGTYEIAEFDLTEVSPEDLKLLEHGAIFYWSIGETMSNGQLKKESIIRFKRSSPLTASEIDAIEDRAEERFKNISWD